MVSSDIFAKSSLLTLQWDIIFFREQNASTILEFTQNLIKREKKMNI